MKPQCPTRCGQPINDKHALCDACWSLVPAEMKNAIANAWKIVRDTRKANKMHAALRRHRDARDAAIQYVIGLKKQNEKVSA